MSDKKRIKYLTKNVRFGGKALTLYSIDGNTWSTRRDELVTILERHENERLSVGRAIGERAAGEETGEISADDTEREGAPDTKEESDSPSTGKRKIQPNAALTPKKVPFKPTLRSVASTSKSTQKDVPQRKLKRVAPVSKKRPPVRSTSKGKGVAAKKGAKIKRKAA